MQLSNIFMKNYQKISLAAIVLCALIAFAIIVVNNYKTKTSFKHNQENATTAEAEKAAQVPQDDVSAAVNEAAQAEMENPSNNLSDNEVLQISANDIVLGDANAPVTMFEYSSLSCPHCAAFNREAFEKIKEEYVDTNMVKFIRRDFPLNQPALAASMFALCHSDKNPEKYHYLLKALFKTQDSWAFDPNFIEKIRSIAQLDGMNSDDFNSCINDESLKDRILADRMTASKSLAIRSTPTFFINGEKSQGYVDYLSLKKIIDEKLAQAK